MSVATLQHGCDPNHVVRYVLTQVPDAVVEFVNHEHEYVIKSDCEQELLDEAVQNVVSGGWSRRSGEKMYRQWLLEEAELAAERKGFFSMTEACTFVNDPDLGVAANECVVWRAAAYKWYREQVALLVNTRPLTRDGFVAGLPSLKGEVKKTVMQKVKAWFKR